eukprot:scaffold170213_cov18-Tisochrysis_lutea.AAC.4
MSTASSATTPFAPLEETESCGLYHGVQTYWQPHNRPVGRRIQNMGWTQDGKVGAIKGSQGIGRRLPAWCHQALHCNICGRQCFKGRDRAVVRKTSIGVAGDLAWAVSAVG